MRTEGMCFLEVLSPSWSFSSENTPLSCTSRDIRNWTQFNFSGARCSKRWTRDEPYISSAPKKGVSPGNQNEVTWASDKIDDTQFSNIPNPVSFLFKWKSCLHLQMGRISSSLSKDLLSFCISHTGRNHRTVSGKVNAGPMMWRRRDNSPTQPHSNHRLRMKR